MLGSGKKKKKDVLLQLRCPFSNIIINNINDYIININVFEAKN